MKLAIVVSIVIYTSRARPGASREYPKAKKADRCAKPIRELGSSATFQQNHQLPRGNAPPDPSDSKSRNFIAASSEIGGQLVTDPRIATEGNCALYLRFEEFDIDGAGSDFPCRRECFCNSRLALEIINAIINC